jgi:DNA helicase-2/ATP-dependent DNA helicase PcrA
MRRHSAKGLEFAVVFIAGLEEGICPSISPGSHLEEEHRLFKVAMTRAKQKLFLTRSTARHGSLCEASRFLDEVPSQLFTFPNRSKTQQKKKQATQLRMF